MQDNDMHRPGNIFITLDQLNDINFQVLDHISGNWKWLSQPKHIPSKSGDIISRVAKWSIYYLSFMKSAMPHRMIAFRGAFFWIEMSPCIIECESSALENDVEWFGGRQF